MQAGIGTALREAREKRGLQLADVEAAIKIRLRFLRALEAEEWDALPGGVYTRSFIRAYATHLGLDGQRLADEFERSAGLDGERPARVQAPLPRGRRTNRLGGRAAVIGICAVALIALVAIGLSGGGGGGGGGVTAPAKRAAADSGIRHESDPSKPAQRSGVSVRLVASAEIWVCLLDARRRPLIDGRILPGGSKEGPFHSGSFTVAFGNGEVEMTVNGRIADIPASASPLGYTIERDGRLVPLSEGERPTCA